jgi:hypothetical protein
LACKRKQYKQIVVFDFFQKLGQFDELDKNLRIMNFKQKVTSHLLVKISKDFQKVVFTNRKE